MSWCVQLHHKSDRSPGEERYQIQILCGTSDLNTLVSLIRVWCYKWKFCIRCLVTEILRVFVTRHRISGFLQPDFGFSKLLISGNPAFPYFPKSVYLEIQKSELQNTCDVSDFRNFENSAPRKSGCPEVRDFGISEVRKSGIPNSWWTASCMMITRR